MTQVQRKKRARMALKKHLKQQVAATLAVASVMGSVLGAPFVHAETTNGTPNWTYQNGVAEAELIGRSQDEDLTVETVMTHIAQLFDGPKNEMLELQKKVEALPLSQEKISQFYNQITQVIDTFQDGLSAVKSNIKSQDSQLLGTVELAKLKNDADYIADFHLTRVKSLFKQAVEDSQAKVPQAESNIREVTLDNGYNGHSIQWLKGVNVRGKVFQENTGEGSLEKAYAPGEGWFDANKNFKRDKNLCSAAVAANSLQWWLAQNKDNVARFLEDKSKGFTPQKSEQFPHFYHVSYLLPEPATQSDSHIFQMFTDKYGYNDNSVIPNMTMDSFINGYHNTKTLYKNNEDSYDINETESFAGYFRDVFGGKLLTNRESLQGLTKETFTQKIKENLDQDRAISLSYEVLRDSVAHVISVWGAEYDENGNIVALYISDSDNGSRKLHGSNDRVGMSRYKVTYEDGRIYLSGGKQRGAAISELFTLDLGTEQWASYLAKNGQ